jgi:hypothetical protein
VNCNRLKRRALLTVLLLPMVALAMRHAISVAASVPEYYAVPCPGGSSADALHVTWRTDHLQTVHGSTKGLRESGMRTMHNVAFVRKLYRLVCGLVLIHYNHPVATACPAAHNSATYHVVFDHMRRQLIAVTERVQGCVSISVDGKPKLGSTHFFDLSSYLPPSVQRIDSGVLPAVGQIVDNDPCPANFRPTVLVVRRTNAYPGNVLAASSPLKRRVANVARIAALFGIVCRLRLVVNPRRYHCPADIGIAYHLRFSSSHRTFDVTGNATGCTWLWKGTQPYKPIAWWLTPVFWSKLRVCLGMQRSSLFGMAQR